MVSNTALDRLFQFLWCLNLFTNTVRFPWPCLSLFAPKTTRHLTVLQSPMLGAGAARLDGLPGCSLPWKYQGKRFCQTATLALSLDLGTKISQHNHLRYFRHHFGSAFPRNPTKPMFRCLPTTPRMRWRFQHTCQWIWRFRGCHPHSPEGKKPNNWLQKTRWYIHQSQSVFDLLMINV